MILPGPFRPDTGVTPVSMRATSTPAPVYPASHHAAAPEYDVVLYIESMSSAGSYDDAAAGRAETTRPVAARTRHATRVATVRRRVGRRRGTRTSNGTESHRVPCPAITWVLVIVASPARSFGALYRISGRRKRTSSGIRADLDLRSVSNRESVGVRAGPIHRPRTTAGPSPERSTGPCAALDLLSSTESRSAGQESRAAMFFAARFAMP